MDGLAWLVVAPVALPVVVFAAECIAGFAGAGAARATPAPPPFVVIMPAHDEAAGIGRAITAVRGQLRPCDRLLVVADNCTDDTAAIARGLGAEVVERRNSVERGKGHALAFGCAALAGSPPDIVIVLDADCWPEPDALLRLAAAAATGDVVQGRYELATPAGAGTAAQVSGFAFAVKNVVRQRGLQRLGGPALLQGSGMAFPWAVFRGAPLASANLVEDMELGIALARAGDRIRFLDGARFGSAASSRDATVTQRTRWEHGTLATGWRAAPGLWGAALRGRPRLALLALDLIVPPLALLAALVLAAIGIAGGAALIGGSVLPVLAALTLGMMLSGAVLLGWLAVGRQHLSPATLAGVPAYMLWKLPIYLRLAGRRQRLWVRTHRDV